MTPLRSLLRPVAASLPGWLTSLAAYALVVYGVWLVYTPAGYVLGGVLLLPLEWTAEKVWTASRQ